YLQPQAPDVPAALDRRLDTLRSPLSRAGSRAVDSRHAAADRAGSLALRRRGAVLFSRRAALFATQTVEICLRYRGSTLGRLGRIQRPASVQCDGGLAGLAAFHGCRDRLLAGEQAPGNAS